MVNKVADPQNDVNNKAALPHGLLITALTVVSYCVAFAFEAGFADYYAIPYFFIEITVTQILIACASVLSSIYVFYLLAAFINPFWSSLWKKIPAPVKPRVRIHLSFVLMTVLFMAIAGFSIPELTFFWIIWGIAILFDFGLPILPRSDIKGYANKVLYYHQQDLSYDTVLDKTVKVVGFGIFINSALFFVLIAMSYMSGLGVAKKQETFFVSNKDANIVLLHKYGGTLILAHIDRSTKEADQLVVHQLDSQFQLSFRNEKIGPLHVKR